MFTQFNPELVRTQIERNNEQIKNLKQHYKEAVARRDEALAQIKAYEEFKPIVEAHANEVLKACYDAADGLLDDHFKEEYKDFLTYEINFSAKLTNFIDKNLYNAYVMNKYTRPVNSLHDECEALGIDVSKDTFLFDHREAHKLPKGVSIQSLAYLSEDKHRGRYGSFKEQIEGFLNRITTLSAQNKEFQAQLDEHDVLRNNLSK